MKTDIHPTYFPEASVTCACGNTWKTGSTKEELRVDICSNCHPFYTGEQRIVDTEGQVDRFYKRLEARQQHIAEEEQKHAARISPERPMADLGLNKRAVDSFKKADIENAGQFLAKLAEGDEAVLAIDGVGRKALSDAKKFLRRFGYPLPEDAASEEETKKEAA